VGLGEYFVDLGQTMPFDERQHGDFAAKDQFEGVRVVLWQAAPAAERTRVKCHQVGQPDFDFVHRKTDDAQTGTEGQQAKCSGLTCGCAGAFKNLPFRLAQPTVFGELPDGIAHIFAPHFLRIYRHADTAALELIELRLVDVDGNNRGASCSRDLSRVTADTANANNDRQVSGFDFRLYDSLLGRG